MTINEIAQTVLQLSLELEKKINSNVRFVNSHEETIDHLTDAKGELEQAFLSLTYAGFIYQNSDKNSIDKPTHRA